MESSGWMEIIASFGGSLGMGAIFLYLYVQERKSSKEAVERQQALAQENTEKMMTAFMENTKVIQGFKHVLQDNSRVLERLCSQVDDHTKRS